MAASLLLAIGAVCNLIGMEKGPYKQGVEQASFREACSFLRARVKPESVLVSWNPRVLALYTGLLSAWWHPFTNDDSAFDRYLQRIHAGYLLVYMTGEDDPKWLLPHLERQPNRFPLLFRNSDFRVYAAE